MYRLAVLLLLTTASALTAQTPIDPDQAKAAFTEAARLSTRDAGRLWGRPLYGPMFFVDPATRAVVANQPDPQRTLYPEPGGVFTGQLPASIPPANSSVEWLGTRWTMILWPLPATTEDREQTMAHELFHRLQPDLHLPQSDPSNPQLDSLEGRLWLQLEWRALAAALASQSPASQSHASQGQASQGQASQGQAQTEALRDALAFADYRHTLFPGSAKDERALELNEGVAEYTGVAAAASDPASARWYSIGTLTRPDPSHTLTRSFAYTSGPAHGLLLDQRLPGWRTRLTAASNLTALLASTLPPATQPAQPLEIRAALYGAASLRAAETEREIAAQVERARYRQLLVDGPTLLLPSVAGLHFSFNPGKLIALGDAGTVYPTLQASDSWGTLEVSEGALINSAFDQIHVAAPQPGQSGPHLQGPGWTLTLAPGWHVIPASRPGSFTLSDK